MRRTLFLAGAACLLATPAPAEKLSKDYDESFAVTRGMRLVLAHGDGEVTLSPWDRDVVRVIVHYRAEVNRIGWGSDLEFEVEFSAGSDAIRVLGRESGFGGVGIFTSDVKSYTYTISAPPWLDVESTGEDGDVRIADWTGRLDIGLDDGDLELERIHAEQVTVRVEDGDVTIRDSRGRFDLEMDDGDLDLVRVEAEMLRVEMEDGDVSADLVGVPGMDVEISGDDGRVDVSLPADASCRFSLRTRDGRIALEAPDAPRIARDARQASGTIGDGEGEVRLSTSDGPVTLRIRS